MEISHTYKSMMRYEFRYTSILLMLVFFVCDAKNLHFNKDPYQSIDTGINQIKSGKFKRQLSDGMNDPPTPEYKTSCHEKQDNRYESLQNAWEDCVKDSLCKGVYDSECDDKHWRLCYGEPKSSRNSCIYPRISTSSDECRTKNTGPEPDKPCVFPFQFRGIEYSECTTDGYGSTYWCGTTFSVTNNAGWGVCSSSCISAPDGWKKEYKKFCPFCNKTYETVQDAKTGCKLDPNCNVIYDLFCDAIGYFCQCPLNSIISQTHPHAIDCIYIKE